MSAFLVVVLLLGAAACCGLGILLMIQRYGGDAVAHGEAIGASMAGTKTSHNSMFDAVERIRRGPDQP